MLFLGVWFDFQINGRSYGLVMGDRVRWLDFYFRKFFLVVEDEDQRGEEISSRLVWSLLYKFSKNQRKEYYLDFVF